MRALLTKLAVLILIISTKPAVCQQSLSVALEDRVVLTGDTYRGEIQWQYSNDNSEWVDYNGGAINGLEVVIGQERMYYRARIEEEGCTPHFSEVIEIESTTSTNLWSDPATWGSAGKPQAGDEVTIAEGDYIILDETPPDLGGLLINGVLSFDRSDLSLTTEWIVVNGTLRVGTTENPFTQKAIITLNDQDTEAEIMGMGTRGIMVMNGNLELHGASPDVIWTKINAHGELGSTSLTLTEEVDWKAEDQIVIAPTDYYEAGAGISVTQRVGLTEVNGTTLTLAEGLNAHRWGLLQYPTTDGMSLSPNGLVTAPLPDTGNEITPLVLDERAEVGNLTRNIVIQSADDELWAQGFGAHTMIMPSATAHVEGVEFRRVGQEGRLRRYPFHWHMLSYSGTETLADATGQYFRNNTINNSANRGIVIHGTNGVLVQNNIVYDVRGHGLFTEDAVERRNIIDGNLILHVRNPEWGSQLMMHEVGDFGSSGFWIANPDNVVTNNTAADCQTFGYWLAFPSRPFGLSNAVLYDDGILMRPNRLEFGIFDNNTAHSNRNDGIHIDDPQSDDEGNTTPLQYWSTTDGRTDIHTNSFENLRRFALSRIKTWKNMDNGSWDRGVWTDMYEFVSADNCGRFFAGSGADGVIERSLIVGTSLNFMMNGTGRPDIADFQFFPSAAPTAFATYHSAFSMRNNVVVNFQVTAHDRAGVFATDDYYFRPVDKGQVRNYDNLLIASDPGVKLKASNSYFTLASALWDPYGHWGPEENYLVYDDSFLTYGKDVTIPALGSEVVGGVSVPGPFYGFLGFVLHGVGPGPPQNYNFEDFMAIHVDRYDPADLATPVGSWAVTTSQPEWALNHMRDFATSPDGVYELTFPDEIIDPTNFNMEVESMMEESDLQVIGIQFDGSIDPVVFIQQISNTANFHVYEMMNSLEEVMNSNGETWWQDKVNNRMWVKIQGGRWVATPDDEGEFEAEANETMNLIIRAAN
ncbi:MAG: G8 domain-containing protein [Ekhidna sp.]